LLVAVAVAQGAPVGVDVEQHRSFDCSTMARHIVGRSEVPAATREEFFGQWVRKEAVLKATGDGLRTPMREVVLSAAGDPPALIRYADGFLACNLADLTPPLPGYSAALAMLAAQPVTVVEHDATAWVGQRLARAGAVVREPAGRSLAGSQKS
jgi:4'-phosphopantetheinyl transferase